MSLALAGAILAALAALDDAIPPAEERPAALYGKANLLMADGKFDEGKAIVRRLAKIDRRTLPGAPTPDAGFVRDLVAVSGAKHMEGQLDEALQDADFAVAVAEKLFADKTIDPLDYAQALAQRAQVGRAVGPDPATRSQIERALRLIEGSTQSAFRLRQQLMGELSEVMAFEGDLREADSLASDMLKQSRDSLRGNSSRMDQMHVVRQLIRASGFRIALGQNVEGKEFAEEALRMAEALFPVNEFPTGHTLIVDALGRLGDARCAMGMMVEGESDLTRSLRMCEELFASGFGSSSSLMHRMKSVGVARYQIGQYESAATVFEGLRRKYIELYGPQDSASAFYALILNNLAACHSAQGCLSEARDCFRESLEIYRDAFSNRRDGHELTVICLRNLACVAREMGEYESSFSYLQTALQSARRLEELNRSSISIVPELLHDVGVQHLLLGESTTAESFLKSALEINRRRFDTRNWPSGHTDLQMSLVHWARALQHRGATLESRDVLNEALGMATSLYPMESFPSGHDIVVNTLCHMGDVEIDLGRYPSSRELLHRALTMHRGLHPDESDKAAQKVSASIHALIGKSYAAEGRLAEARSAMESSLHLRTAAHESNTNRDHPEIAKAIREIAVLDWRRGAHDAAFQGLADAARREQGMIVGFCSGASEAQTLNFAREQLTTLDYLLSVWDPLGHRAEEVYPYFWERHGLVFQMMTAKHRHARRRDQVSDAYFAARRKLAVEAARSPLDLLALDDERLRALNAEKERAESEMGRLVGHLETVNRNSRADARRLLRAMADDEVFLDVCHFVRYERAGDQLRDTRHFGVFVLQPGHDLQFVDLGPAARIETALRDWLDAIDRDRDTFPAGSAVRQLLWLPIETRLAGKKRRLFIAPEGCLAGIPWMAIPGREAGSFLLEEFECVFVPNGRFLLESLENPIHAPHDRTAAVGGIDYGATEPGGSTPTWNQLPGSLREVESLGQWVGQESLDLLTGAAASAAVFADASQKAAIVHVATHGFVNRDFESSVFEPRARQSHERVRHVPGERVSVHGRNPLLLCGLVFAGANQPTRADGPVYLTGEDVATLRLDGVRVAFLSACETGVGDPQRGEGVFSLQRAFHLAGTRNVVASLWRVDDSATSRLVAGFYRAHLAEGESASQALRSAQLAVLKGAPGAGEAPLRGIGRTPEKLRSGSATVPSGRVRDWAGFVLSGPGR